MDSLDNQVAVGVQKAEKAAGNASWQTSPSTGSTTPVPSGESVGFVLRRRKPKTPSTSDGCQPAQPISGTGSVRRGDHGVCQDRNEESLQVGADTRQVATGQLEGGDSLEPGQDDAADKNAPVAGSSASKSLDAESSSTTTATNSANTSNSTAKPSPTRKSSKSESLPRGCKCCKRFLVAVIVLGALFALSVPFLLSHGFAFLLAYPHMFIRNGIPLTKHMGAPDHKIFQEIERESPRRHYGMHYEHVEFKSPRDPILHVPVATDTAEGTLASTSGPMCQWNTYSPYESHYSYLTSFFQSSSVPASESANSSGFDSEDLVTVRGWFVPGSTRAGGASTRKNTGSVGPSGVCVVTVHGGGNDRREFLAHMRQWHDHGHSTLMIDLRERGASDRTGRGISYGFREHADVIKAAEYLRTHRADVCKKIVAVGASAGAAAVQIAVHQAEGRSSLEQCHYDFTRPSEEADSERELPAPLFDGVISIATLSSFRGLLGRQMDGNPHARAILHRFASASHPLVASIARRILPVPSWMQNMFLSSLLSRLSGHEAVSPEESIRRGRIPALLIHGTDDDIVPFEEMESLHQAAKSANRENVKVIRVDRGNHNTWMLSQNREVMRSVLDFLNQFRST